MQTNPYQAKDLRFALRNADRLSRRVLRQEAVVNRARMNGWPRELEDALLASLYDRKRRVLGRLKRIEAYLDSNC